MGGDLRTSLPLEFPIMIQAASREPLLNRTLLVIKFLLGDQPKRLTFIVDLVGEFPSAIARHARNVLHQALVRAETLLKSSFNTITL